MLSPWLFFTTVLDVQLLNEFLEFVSLRFILAELMGEGQALQAAFAFPAF